MKLTFNIGTGQTVTHNLTNNIVEYITVNNGTVVKITTCGCDKGGQDE